MTPPKPRNEHLLDLFDGVLSRGTACEIRHESGLLKVLGGSCGLVCECRQAVVINQEKKMHKHTIV